MAFRPLRQQLADGEVDQFGGVVRRSVGTPEEGFTRWRHCHRVLLVGPFDGMVPAASIVEYELKTSSDCMATHCNQACIQGLLGSLQYESIVKLSRHMIDPRRRTLLRSPNLGGGPCYSPPTPQSPSPRKASRRCCRPRAASRTPPWRT